jgi:hypothetical protein
MKRCVIATQIKSTVIVDFVKMVRPVAMIPQTDGGDQNQYISVSAQRGIKISLLTFISIVQNLKSVTMAWRT